jgi:hypothetical protein
MQQLKPTNKPDPEEHEPSDTIDRNILDIGLDGELTRTGPGKRKRSGKDTSFVMSKQDKGK